MKIWLTLFYSPFFAIDARSIFSKDVILLLSYERQGDQIPFKFPKKNLKDFPYSYKHEKGTRGL